MLRSEDWLIITDVSGQPICNIFKSQAVQEERLDFLTFENGTDRLSRNVGTELPFYAA